MNGDIDVISISREIKSYIGDKEYKKIHKSNKLIDSCTTLFTIMIFFSLIIIIGKNETTWVKILLIVVQGFFIQIMALVHHDIFVHRRLGK